MEAPQGQIAKRRTSLQLTYSDPGTTDDLELPVWSGNYVTRSCAHVAKLLTLHEVQPRV